MPVLHPPAVQDYTAHTWNIKLTKTSYKNRVSMSKEKYLVIQFSPEIVYAVTKIEKP